MTSFWVSSFDLGSGFRYQFQGISSGSEFRRRLYSARIRLALGVFETPTAQFSGSRGFRGIMI